MTDKPAAADPIPTEQIPSVAGGISAIGSANAPIVFVDGVPVMGYYNGIAHMTLAAMRFLPGPERVISDNVIVAHLRMNMPALQALKEAITKIELLAAPVDEKSKN